MNYDLPKGCWKIGVGEESNLTENCAYNNLYLPNYKMTFTYKRDQRNRCAQTEYPRPSVRAGESEPLWANWLWHAKDLETVQYISVHDCW